MTNLKTQFQIGRWTNIIFFFFLILELAQKTSCLLALWSLNRHPSLCLRLNEVTTSTLYTKPMLRRNYKIHMVDK